MLISVLKMSNRSALTTSATSKIFKLPLKIQAMKEDFKFRLKIKIEIIYSLIPFYKLGDQCFLKWILRRSTLKTMCSCL